MKRWPPATIRLLAWGCALTALSAVFFAYTRPDFMLRLANQVWACF